MRLLLVWALLLPPAAAAADFFPACLKRDGDWLQGVTAKECHSLRGVWRSGKAKRRR